MLGGGVVVRSDEVEGNEVRGTATSPTGEHGFVATFADDGQLLDCAVDQAAG